MDYMNQGEVHIYQHYLDNFLEVTQQRKIEELLSSEKTDRSKNYYRRQNLQLCPFPGHLVVITSWESYIMKYGPTLGNVMTNLLIWSF